VCPADRVLCLVESEEGLFQLTAAAPGDGNV
jgi:hypothetical protein